MITCSCKDRYPAPPSSYEMTNDYTYSKSQFFFSWIAFAYFCQDENSYSSNRDEVVVATCVIARCTAQNLHQKGIIFVCTLGPFEKEITRLLWWETVDLACPFSRCWLALKRTRHSINTACPTVYFSMTFSIEMSSHQHAVTVRVVCSRTGGQVHTVAVCR